MLIVAFEVMGDPVGKGRPKFARRGDYVNTYTPKKTAMYETRVQVAARQAMGAQLPHTGAMAVWLSLDIAIPLSWSKKKQQQALAFEIYPTSKPDVDNVLKAILDACNGIVWVDDKQVIDVIIHKRYALSGSAKVQVEAR